MTVALSAKADEQRLLTVDEALHRAGGRPGRSLAYRQIAETDTFLGVRVIRVGNRVFVPRMALDRVLSGEVVREEVPGDEI